MSFYKYQSLPLYTDYLNSRKITLKDLAGFDEKDLSDPKRESVNVKDLHKIRDAHWKDHDVIKQFIRGVRNGGGKVEMVHLDKNRESTFEPLTSLLLEPFLSQTGDFIESNRTALDLISKKESILQFFQLLFGNRNIDVIFNPYITQNISFFFSTTTNNIAGTVNGVEDEIFKGVSITKENILEIKNSNIHTVIIINEEFIKKIIRSTIKGQLVKSITRRDESSLTRRADIVDNVNQILTRLIVPNILCGYFTSCRRSKFFDYNIFALLDLIKENRITSLPYIVLNVADLCEYSTSTLYENLLFNLIPDFKRIKEGTSIFNRYVYGENFKLHTLIRPKNLFATNMTKNDKEVLDAIIINHIVKVTNNLSRVITGYKIPVYKFTKMISNNVKICKEMRTNSSNAFSKRIYGDCIIRLDNTYELIDKTLATKVSLD